MYFPTNEMTLNNSVYLKQTVLTVLFTVSAAAWLVMFFFLYVPRCMCRVHVQASSHGSQKRVLDALGSELHTVLCQRVGAENRT